MNKGLKALEKLYKLMPFVFEESKTKMSCLETIEKELKEPINLINKELRNAKKLLTYDNYRCGYIDALINIKNKIKGQDNEK